MNIDEAKHDQGKPKPSLVYKSLIDEVARVRQHGIEKYKNPENWRMVEEQRYIDAMLRHVLAYADGEFRDKESGFSHLAHAVCCAMFIIEQHANPIKHENILKHMLDKHQHKEKKLVTLECPNCHFIARYPVGNRNFCGGNCGTIIKS
jgi:hypothetical protein